MASIDHNETRKQSVCFSPPVLRDYQLAGDEQLRSLIRAGKRRLLTVAPTGAGKGTWLADVVRRAVANGKRCIFVVAGREIVLDFSRRLDGLHLDHGIIMGDHPRRRPWLNVHVASVDTLRRRNPPAADILLFDECDLNINAWVSLIQHYPQAIFLGTTATPIRVDGRGLGELFEAMIEWPQAPELMARGYLVRPVLYGPNPPDLAGVHRVAGEFNQREVATVVDRPKLVGDAVEHWVRHDGRLLPTAAFGVNRAHARHIRDAFTAAGFQFAYVDGETPSDERQRTWHALREHTIHGCVSIGVIGRGWDMPALSCLIDLAPTASLARCLQRWGRVLRPAPGKERTLILDHAGNWMRHGLPDEQREWTLEGAKRKPRADRDPALSVRMCLQCWAAFSSRESTCPHCGWQYVAKTVQPETVAGELQEITARPAYTIRHLSNDPEIARLQKIAQERGYKPGWVWIERERLREKRSKAARVDAPQRARDLFEVSA